MYRNLLAEMVRNNITKKQIAKFLDLRVATICDKMNGKYSFKLDEAFRIKKEFFPQLTIEYLFATDSREKAS